MKRHRILYIEFLKITAANHLAMIIKGVMQRLDCEIVLLCEKDSLLARTFRNTSVIVYEIPFQELMIRDFHTYLPFLRHILLIFRILIRYRITLIHVHRLNWAYLAIVPSLLFRIPLVVHIVIIERLSSKFQNKLLLLHRSIHYIAVSNDAARKFIKTYPVSSSHVHIHYGGLYFPDMELARNIYISKQELPKKAAIVAMVSRMDPLKGVDVFIEAAAILHKQFPAIQFIHIGDHDDYVFQEGYGRECKSRVKNLGLSRVFSFRPYTENILAYYKYFSIMVLPTLKDTLSFVNLEANYFGVPVIFTDIDGLMETSRRSFGSFVPYPPSPVLLAEKVYYFLNNKKAYENLARNGENLIRQKFDAEKNTDHLIELYESL